MDHSTHKHGQRSRGALDVPTPIPTSVPIPIPIPIVASDRATHVDCSDPTPLYPTRPLTPVSLPTLAGALAQARQAQQVAHSLRARLTFLADAPAAALASPYQVRRSVRGMLRDVAQVCRQLDNLATHEGIAQMLACRDAASSNTGDGERNHAN